MTVSEYRCISGHVVSILVVTADSAVTIVAVTVVAAAAVVAVVAVALAVAFVGCCCCCLLLLLLLLVLRSLLLLQLLMLNKPIESQTRSSMLSLNAIALSHVTFFWQAQEAQHSFG